MTTPDGFRATTLDEWRRWEHSQRRSERFVRSLKARLRPAPEPAVTLWRPRGEIRTVVLADKLTPSCRAAVEAPLRHLDPAHTAVVAYADAELGLDERWEDEPFTVGALPGTVRRVLALAATGGLGEELHAWCAQRDAAFVIAQHGLLTPWAPPAPPGAHVLAWSEADAEFWRSGAAPVTTHVIGSQMLWDAAGQPPVEVVDDRPLVLGQLHGVELGRRGALDAYLHFCRRVPSDYRPHPNESDAVSRALHVAMRRSGVTFDDSPPGTSMLDLGRPVVSVFSTGTLEAAVRGLPAWVMHPDPPDWVRSFWSRYGLAEWGGEPTTPWPSPTEEPARATAEILESL